MLFSQSISSNFRFTTPPDLKPYFIKSIIIAYARLPSALLQSIELTILFISPLVKMEGSFLFLIYLMSGIHETISLSILPYTRR